MTAFGALALTRHADVTAVLRDNVTFQHRYVDQQRARVGHAVEAEAYFDYFRRMIFVLDDPDHLRVRRLMQGAFTPAQMSAALIPNAAEQLMRYDTPGQGTARVVTADTVVGDVSITARSIVLAYIGAANRDADVYPDPDVLDITREFSAANRPATWGGGAHLCIGRALAQQEMEALLEVLAERCPNLSVGDFAFRPTPLMRGLEHLHISW